MKLIVAAAVAAFAMPAIAQDMPASPPPAPQTMPMPAQPAPPADPAAVAPMPETPMPAPMPPAPMAAPAPMPQASYPMCSKTVTDSCMERSNAKGERLHSTPRKPG